MALKTQFISTRFEKHEIGFHGEKNNDGRGFIQSK